MHITDKQKDVFKEVINIRVGESAGILNELLNTHISLQVPDIKIFSYNDMEKEMAGLLEKKLSAVWMEFSGPVTGITSLIFPPEDASKLIDLILNNVGEAEDPDSVRIGILSEVGNIILNSVVGSLGDLFNERILFTLPAYFEDTLRRFIASSKLDRDLIILLADSRFYIKEHMIEGEIIVLIGMDGFESLIDAMETSFGFLNFRG